MTLTHLKVIKIMRRRNFYRTRSLFRIGIIIGNHWDQTTDQRQHDVFADQMLEFLILWMNSNRRIAQHGFRSGGGDRHESVAIFRIIGLAINRIIKIIQMPVRVLA